MKNFILFFLIFFSFDTMSQQNGFNQSSQQYAKTVDEFKDNNEYDHEYDRDYNRGFEEGVSIIGREDVIELIISEDETIPSGYIKLMLSKSSNVSWWKGIKCVDGKYCLGGTSYILQVWDKGDYNSDDQRFQMIDMPQTFVAPAKFFKKGRFKLAKAKGFGAFEDQYDFIPNEGWQEGKTYHIRWLADCVINCNLLD